MQTVFKKTPILTDAVLHYCPGCGHGIVHRLVAEVVEELGIQDRTIAIVPVGCAVFGYKYFNLDSIEAAHGRAPAVGTGVKRTDPNRVVFTYQGDGDLASIGAAEIVHAAHRGEHICTIFVNNAIYGMTGGQMAPTTLVGQKTTTSPKGRDEAWCGAPIRVAEMLSTIPGSYYIERCAVNNNANINKTKKAIKKAWSFENDAFMTNVTFETVSIKNNNLRHKVMKLMKIDSNGIKLPLWNGSFIRFSKKCDKAVTE